MLGSLVSLFNSARAAMDSGRGKGRPGSKRGPPCRDDGLAPETPTQALETGKKRRITRDCPLLDLPEGVLEQSLLFDAGPRDLCSLAQTCSRLRTLVDVSLKFVGELGSLWVCVCVYGCNARSSSHAHRWTVLVVPALKVLCFVFGFLDGGYRRYALLAI